MHSVYALFAIFTVVNGNLIVSPIDDGTETGEWLVRITDGIETAERIAYREGFQKVKEIALMKLYHFRDYNPQQEHEKHISVRLLKYKEISWMRPVQRWKITQNFRHLTYEPLLGSVIIENAIPITLISSRRILCAGPEGDVVKSTKPTFFNDWAYPIQWYLRSCKEVTKGQPTVYDSRVLHTWERFKVFGKGVKVGIMDFGVWDGNDDLDVDLEHSFDPFSRKNDPNPKTLDESHGTMCAGIIAMKGNNNFGGVGIAPHATIISLKITEDSIFDDGIQTQMFLHHVEEIDIVMRAISYHDYAALIRHSKDVETALQIGVTKGRHGKGTLYVLSSGNDKPKGYNCEVKAYQSSIYVINIGGVNHDGSISSYAERCSSVMAVTYSGDSNPYSFVTVSTADPKKYYVGFTGTSASSPMAAGILALVIEANPNLTWREVQHLIAWNSIVAPMEKNPGWKENAAGFKVSPDFGFGMLNAYDMVEMALQFQPIPPMHVCVIHNQQTMTNIPWSRFSPVNLTFEAKACEGEATEVNYIEHILLNTTMTYGRRGDIQISLISPQGTETTMLEPRPHDRFFQPIYDYDLHSLHTWGENPKGKWTVKIFDDAGEAGNQGIVRRIELIIIGTKEQPPHYKNGKRKYYSG